MHAFLETGDAAVLGQARKRFMKLHGKVFWALGLLQRFWYGTDKRREKFVAMCRDPDVRRLPGSPTPPKSWSGDAPLRTSASFSKM